jgi:hypothetical protein
MRYAVHRYFLQSYHISIIGLETATDGSINTEAALLTNFVPSYVRDVLEGKEATSGFSLADAVALTAVLGQLILDSSSRFLALMYRVNGKDAGTLHPLATVNKLVQEFVLYWMMGYTEEMVVKDVESNRTETDVWRNGYLHERFDSLALSAVRGFMFERWREPRYYASKRDSGSIWHPLSDKFSFTDVQNMVMGIVHTFGNFWASECDNLKQSLVEIDNSETGRVQLSDFHRTTARGQWEFTESADFLRQVGALDETSSWRGGRVIITNYMQATSNCVVLTSHYRVCCANECEEHMDELETVVGAPDAVPEILLSAVENISAAWYGDEDIFDYDDGEVYHDGDGLQSYDETSLGKKRVELPDALRQQLHDIALAQGGKVPLHGRLFAQWLHYAFPHECPYPHKSGTISSVTPSSFEEDGGSFKASREEILEHHQKADEMYDRFNSESESVDDQGEFMSQWDHEEELLAEHVDLKAPWERRRRTFCFLLASAGFVLVFALYSGIGASTFKSDTLAPSKYY